MGVEPLVKAVFSYRGGRTVTLEGDALAQWEAEYQQALVIYALVMQQKANQQAAGTMPAPAQEEDPSNVVTLQDHIKKKRGE